MAVELVPESFSGHIGDRFTATPTFAGEPTELELAACDVGEGGLADGRVPFSLIFLADSADALPQQIVGLSHPDVGDVPLFIVPLGPQEGRMRYEAVIN